MSANDPTSSLTHHAMLVAWGIYARQIGLIKALTDVALAQKRRDHTPQTKVIEFLVAMLAGYPYLKDISRSAHPLDQDQAVARSWEQGAWADHSGVSRTLSSLSQAEVDELTKAIATVSQPFIDREIVLALGQAGYLIYDGDLTGRPVSNTATSYPGADYGHMGDIIALGYQAAMVSMHSPSYGRLWLSVKPHGGDKVACTQLQEMVRTTEATTGVRPRRRIELVRAKIERLSAASQEVKAKLEAAQQRQQQAQAKRDQVAQQLHHWQTQQTQLQADYERLERPLRPYSALARAQHKVTVYEKRLARRERDLLKAQRWLQRRQDRYGAALAAEKDSLEQLVELKADNAANQAPVRIIFRLDAGFGTHENVDWLIEMGYDLYTKPFSHRVAPALQAELTAEPDWQAVGRNAEMVAWPSRQLANYRYPLDVALARYHQGDQIRHTAFLHYGRNPVCQDLPAWFHTYNGRQTIEAGIKEGKGVFQMHHLKVRAQPALHLQEVFATLAANFVRWAAVWLAQQSQTASDQLQALLARPETPVKHLVQVAAHTSAWVFWQDDGCVLRFTQHSLYADQTWQLGGPYYIQLPLPLFQNSTFY